MNEAELRTQIERVLSDYPDPETGAGLFGTGQIRKLAIENGVVRFDLALTTHAAPLWRETLDALEERLKAVDPSIREVKIGLLEHPSRPTPLGQVKLSAKSVIAVGSGKGGVGKSTIAAAIAFGLHRTGAKVGLLDADVYGPSAPQLLGVREMAHATEQNRVEPIRVDGVPVMSMGLLVPTDQAVVWRGPMVHKAIAQFLALTEWGDLDYLVIDMPPGTGDIPLTLSQMLPITGAVAVCTPQKVALLDAVKAISMFRKVEIPILGMVENMSFFLCPDNGKRYDIFGHGGARTAAEELGMPFLGEVPIHIPLREHGDAGTSPAAFDDPQIAPYLERVAYAVAKEVSRLRTTAGTSQFELPVL
jgi:ATP-binding protein involved in chromosome partitioning